MSASTNLSLPYLAAGQAQKHVTVNESLRKLDAIVQLSVESTTTTAEPGAPSDGETYIVPAGKTGTNWATFTNWAIGYYRDGAWEQITPREGWTAYVRDTAELLTYDGSGWARVSVGRDGDEMSGKLSLNLGGAALPAMLSGSQLLQASGGAGTARYLFGSLAGFTDWRFQRINGSLASPTNLTNGDIISSISSTGYGATGPNWGGGTLILSTATEDWTDANGGAQLIFRSTPNGGGSTTDRFVIDQDGAARPASDNAYDFGNASYRWAEVFAATGTINTSDAREKTDLRPLNEREAAAVRKVMSGVGVFQWRDAIAGKGPDPNLGGARLHCGVTAQAVRDAFIAEGLDPQHYGLFCADPVFETVESEPDRIIQRPVTDPETGEQMVRLGVRYDQLFAMALGTLMTS